MRAAHRLIFAVILVASSVVAFTPLSAAPAAPILFEKNEGQFPRELDYVARAEGQSFFLEGDRATVAVGPASTPSTLHLTFAGARKNVAPAGGDLAASRTNYMRGNDRSKWVYGAPSYHSVRYENLYPGIDIEYHARRGKLEYDFIVAPGADWKRIAVEFEGTKPLLDASGNLVLKVGGKEVHQHAPVVYQDIGGERKTIEARYTLEGNRVAFEIGAFDETKPLVIDPVLDFNRVIEPLLSTRPADIAIDGDGRLYVLASILGPAANSLYRGSQTGYLRDIMVTRLSADGTTVLYTTVFGGDRTDTPVALAVDASGYVYATGETESANFPTTSGAFNEYVMDTFALNSRNQRVWVTKLDATTGGIVWSSYLERPLKNLVTTSVGDITVDGDGFPIVVGGTNLEDFPVTPGSPSAGPGGFITKFAKDGQSLVVSKIVGTGFISKAIAAGDSLYVAGGNIETTPGTYAPVREAIHGSTIAKFDTSGNKIWATYWIGGIADMALDSGQNIVTIAAGGGPVTGASYQQEPKGETEIYIAKLSSTGTTLLASTYYGGTKSEQAFGIATGPLDSIVVTGTTNSLDLPVPNGMQRANTTISLGAGSIDVFLAKFDSALTTLEFGTYYGPAEVPVGPLVDPSGDILFSSWGGGTGTWLRGPQTAHAGIEGDAFLARLDLGSTVTMRIESIVPAAVVNDTGGTVDVRGHGFVPGAKILFGPIEMSGPTVAVTAGGTRLRSHVPNGQSGKVDIVIKNPDGSTATLVKGFEHLPTIHELTSLVPSTISTLGGHVTIGGNGFPQNPTVLMEPGPQFGYDITSATTTGISFTMPPVNRPSAILTSTPKPRFRILFPRGDMFSNRSIDMNLELSALPVINDVRPTSGPTTGGGYITITGNHFANKPRVLFGNVHAKSVTFVDPFTLLVLLPPNVGGPAEVRVLNPDNGTVVLSNGFTYRGVSTISPVSGPVSGGTTVTINGFGFSSSGLGVKFGGAAATSVTFVSDTKITAVTPPHVAGFVDLEVTSGTDTFTVPGAFRYLDPPPSVTSVSPTAGPKGGGSVVIVTGTGFASGAEVFFGGAKASSVAFVSATQLNATTAASPAGTFDVIVTNPDQQTATLENGFTYQGINSVTPQKGSPGATVTVEGGGFVSGATVTFGSTAATNVTVVSATQITATAPNVAPGVVDVTVTNPGGVVMTLDDGFRFLPPPPTVTGFSPTSGFPGDTITINGTDFSFVTGVTFNNVDAAAFTVLSATQLTAVVPKTATTGAIEVTTESGSGTSASALTVQQAPAEIASFTPTFGGAGTSVVITGDKLFGATGVTFGGVAALTFEANSRTQLTAFVPDNAFTGPICIATPGGFNGCSATHFGIPPRISSFTPTSGLPGTSVTITGVNFTGATEVTFNGSAATFTVDSATQITATVPAAATSGPIAVITSAGGGLSQTSFGVPPTISGFTPARAPVGGTVTITGLRFTGATQVTFNGTSAAFTVVNATTINAIVPNGTTDGPIHVTTPGGSATSAQTFVVAFPPVISSFTPAKGEPGTVVTISGTDFDGSTQVTFNGAPASFTLNGSTSITATVPATATNGPIAITSPEGTGTSSAIFSLPPVITSFSPNAGTVGATVTITGNNFVGTTAVTFNTTAATSVVINSQEKLTVTVPTGATTGRLSVTTGYGTVSSTFNFTVMSSSAPAVTAIATSATSVALNWTGDATHTYEVRRINHRNENFTNSTIARVTGLSFTDTTAAAGKTYLYNIIDLTTGLIGNNDYATTIVFTDDPLAGGTKVKAVHLTQLRSAVNAMRAAAALSAATFTDATLAGISIKRVHITELRTALNEALLQLNRFASFTDSDLTTSIPVRGVHVRELRDAVK